MLKNKFKGFKAGYVLFACIIAICFMASSFMFSMPNDYIKTHYVRVDAANSSLKTVDDNFRLIAEIAKLEAPGSNMLKYVTSLDMDFYFIYNAAGLRAFSTRVKNGGSVNGILMGNIDLGSSNFTPIADGTRKYTSIFLGCGYKISNLKAVGPNGYDRGLFGYVSNGGVIWNVIVESGSTSAYQGNSAGGIAGSISGDAQVLLCQNWGCSITTSANSSVTTGGIVGYASGTSVIAGCFNKASVSCNANNGGSGLTRKAGGIVGHFAGDSIIECKNTGSISAGNSSTTSKAYAGGIAGYAYEGVIVNCLVASATISASATSTDSGSTGNIMRSTLAYGGGVVGYCESVNYYATIQYCVVRSCTITGGKTQHIYSASAETGWVTTGYDLQQNTVQINGGSFVVAFNRQQIAFKYSVSSTIDLLRNVDDFVGGGVYSYAGLKKSSNSCSRNDGSVDYSASATKYAAAITKSGSGFVYWMPNTTYIDNMLGSSGTPAYSNKGSVSASGNQDLSDGYSEVKKNFSSVSTTYYKISGKSGGTVTTSSEFYVVLDSNSSSNQVSVAYIALIYFNGSYAGGLNLGGFEYTVRSATSASGFSQGSAWYTKNSVDELRCLYWEGDYSIPA